MSATSSPASSMRQICNAAFESEKRAGFDQRRDGVVVVIALAIAENRGAIGGDRDRFLGQRTLWDQVMTPSSRLRHRRRRLVRCG